MSAMYYEYMELLQEETLKATQNMENWLNYLDGASRNFKYGFGEQLLINNQKPKATAIADYATWSGKLGRTVRTGTAMYLPVNVGGKLSVKNFFDVGDTIEKENSLPLPKWEYTDEHKQAVWEHIAMQYGVTDGFETDADVGDILDSAYDTVSKKYLNDNLVAINQALEDSALYSEAAGLDDKYQREQAFETCVYASMALIVNKRLGIRESHEDVLIGMIEPHLHLFNTEASINALGGAVSSLSEEYLRNVEAAVKAFDREQVKIKKERELNEQGVHPGSHEQDDLLRAEVQGRNGQHDGTDERGGHDFQQVGVPIQRGPVVRDGLDGRERPDNQNVVSQHSNGRSTTSTETLGDGTDGLFEGTQQVLGSADGNNRTAQTLSGDRGTSGAAQEIHDGSLSERPGEQSHRDGQSPRPDGMGGQDEQFSGTGTRDNLQRPDIRLNSQNNISTEEAPIDLGAFSMQRIPPMFVVDWKESQYDFDLGLYADGDMIAYDKDGVSFKLNKMGEYNFIASTTSITPIGDILGDKNIPNYIRADMKAYNNGEVTAEQVREINLDRLESYKNKQEVTLEQAHHESLPLPSSNLGFILEFTYLPDPDRFAVRNLYDHDQEGDDLPPIVALSYPDGSVTVHEHNCPNGSMPPSILEDIKEYTAENFERYKNLAEKRMDAFMRSAEEANNTFEPKVSNQNPTPVQMQLTDVEPILPLVLAEYPPSISHSPLLKGWYDVLGHDEQLTYSLARGFNKMLSGGLTITRRGQFQAIFEEMSAPILMQSKLTDAAFEAFHNEGAVVKGQISLGFGSLGNGITVWDRLSDDPETMDYVSIAHISEEGEISWRVGDDYFDDEFREYFKSQVEQQAIEVKKEKGLQVEAETTAIPSYEIGDMLEYKGKPHEIDRIDDSFIRLHNLGTASTYPIFDYVSVSKMNFESMLAVGEIAITKEPAEVPTHNGRPLTENERIENIGGVDFVFTSLRDSADREYSAGEVLNDTPKQEKGTPLWQDYQSISGQHSGYVLFYRLGDFYEVVGENAPIVANALGITVATRDVGLAERVPIVGIPQHSLEGHLKTLEEKGFNVAVRYGRDDVELFTQPQAQSRDAELNAWQKSVEDIASNTEDYTEPFVVIEFMEGTPDRAFQTMERLSFTDADKKFREVETAFRAIPENDGLYDKTYGAIFYKENPEDTER